MKSRSAKTNRPVRAKDRQTPRATGADCAAGASGHRGFDFGAISVADPHGSQELEATRRANLLLRMDAPAPRREPALSPSPRLGFRSDGAPLPADVRHFFEPRLGRPLDDVRIHTDAGSADAAASLGARAFTAGRDIAFAGGEYAPGTPRGRAVIAHELVHVTQPAATRPVIHRLREDEPKGTPIKTFPQNLAKPFKPDPAFYELLAHDISYLENLEGRYLYRADQSFFKQPLPPSPDPLTPRFFDYLSLPQALPDHFALLNRPPDLDGSRALYYEIEKFADPKSGLLVYSLFPNFASEPRIIVFRGTEPNAADIKADADAGGVGRSVFERNRQTIGALLLAAEGRPGSKTVITGHSLGGAMAQWTTAAFQKHVQEVYTFNSPGISKEAAESVPGEKKGGPKVTHYVTRGDIVSTAGDRLIGDNIVRLEGKATHRLEKLVSVGGLALAEKALNAVPALIDTLAGTVRTARKLWAIAWFLNDHNIGIEALQALGTLAGDLHGQRLLRASQVPSSPYPAFNPGGQSPLDFPIDAAELAETAGPAIAKPSGQVTETETEMGRDAIASIVQKALPVIFDQLIPFIEVLKKNAGLTVMIELSPLPVSMIQLLAQKLKPIVRPLVNKIAGAGGLEKLFKRALD
jgi:Domain of unknown function (DUF4157)/Lipase (class 3)